MNAQKNYFVNYFTVIMIMKTKSHGNILAQELCSLLKQHKLTEELFPTHYGVFIKNYGSIERSSGIDTHILIICESGQGFVRNGGIEKKIMPGDILLIPAGCPHSYGSALEHDWTISWIHFSGLKALDFIQSSVDIINPPEIIFNKIKSIFDEFYTCISQDMKLNTLITASQILRYLLSTISFAGLESKNSEHVRQAVDKAIHLMHKSFDRPLTLKQLAVEAGLSISRFSVIFKASTGLSAIDYFNNLKVRHACSYLDSTDLSIGQISELIGIENQHYFSRLFSKSIGISPSKYRKLRLQL